ncbi:MFS transporter [Paenibacillus sp. 1P07SE]|uniref:MFS transporter n=1 Tax=Paenibacillus sp. 1P07SE TaxID=3132209 RepID=UPI0039A52713
MKELIRNRVFVLVMGSDLLQQIGIWIRNMALLYFVVAQTGGNPIAVSLLTLAEYAPIFIFSLIGGVLADRWRPKRTMITGDILSLLSILPILWAVQAGYWQAVFAATAVSAIVSQFSAPSSMKIFKRYVPDEQVGAAMAISQTMMSLFIIGGPVLGTFIYTQYGISLALGSLVVLFSLSALCLSFLPKSEPVARPEKTSVYAEWKSGVVYVKAKRQLVVLFVLYGLIALSTGLIQPLEIFLVTERLQLPEESLQWFTAVSGLGLLLGGIIAGILSTGGKLKGKEGRVLLLGTFGLGLATIVEGLSLWPLLTGGMRLMTGIMLAFMQTILATLMLTSVDESYIGRITGLFTPVFTGFILIGTAVSGFYMQATSLTVVFLTSGLLLAAASLVTLKLRAPQLPVQGAAALSAEE